MVNFDRMIKSRKVYRAIALLLIYSPLTFAGYLCAVRKFGKRGHGDTHYSSIYSFHPSAHSLQMMKDVPKEQADRIFRSCDQRGDGRISLVEFRSTIQKGKEKLKS